MFFVPIKAKRPCRCCGCCNLASPPNLYCDDHAYMNVDRKKIIYRTYRKNRKDLKEQKFYMSSEWAKIRLLRLSMDHNLCQICFIKHHKITIANTVHHLLPIKSDWSKRLDIDNLITVCETCHSNLHRNLKEGGQVGKIT